MSSSIRKAVCLAIVVVFMVSMPTATFAAAGIPENETNISNRYYFVEEKGKEVLLSTTTKTAAQLAIESERKSWINTLAAIGSAQYAGIGNAVSELVAQAHGYGTAARIKVFSRTDKRYRVDSISGKRTLASSKDYIIYKLYVKDGDSYSLYKTKTCVRG